jgi:hypothetical protein
MRRIRSKSIGKGKAMWERHLNALMALLLTGILLGALGIQFIGHEEPCPLCYLQRLGMLGVASGALMNVKFGGRCIFGGFVGLRQFFLHVCPGFETFGKPVWGLSLYTWSFIVFASCVTYISLLFLIFDSKEHEEESVRVTWFGHLASILVFLVAVSNIFGALLQCGLGTCH